MRLAQNVWLGQHVLGGGCGKSVFSITVQAGNLKSVCGEKLTESWV